MKEYGLLNWLAAQHNRADWLVNHCARWEVARHEGERAAYWNVMLTTQHLFRMDDGAAELACKDPQNQYSPET